MGYSHHSKSLPWNSSIPCIFSYSLVNPTHAHVPPPPPPLHPSKKLLSAIGISLHMEEKQSMYHLKSLKEKTLSSCVNG